MYQKPPYTPFSTQFRGGKRAVRSRLKSLFAAPRRRGTALAAAALLAVLLAGTLVACRQAAQPPDLSGIPEEVAAFARREVDSLANIGNERRCFTEAELLGVTLYKSFPDLLPGAEVSVYIPECRLYPALFSDYTGSYREDEEGWYHLDTTSYLVVKEQDGTHTLLTTLHGSDSGLDARGGWEAFIGESLLSMGWADEEDPDEAMLRDGQTAFAKGWLEKIDKVLALFAGRAQSQGESHTDESGQTWHRFKDYTDEADLRAACGILDQSITKTLFDLYVHSPDPIIKAFDGALFFRADSAEVTGLYADFDPESIIIDQWELYTLCSFRVEAAVRTGDTGEWSFTLSSSGDHPVFTSLGRFTADPPNLGVYTKQDVDSAMAAARDNFAARGNSQLDALWFDEDKLLTWRKSYLLNGRGSVNDVTAENVMVLFCDYSFLGDVPDSAPSRKMTGWALIFIRDSADAPWVLDDQGY